FFNLGVCRKSIFKTNFSYFALFCPNNFDNFDKLMKKLKNFADFGKNDLPFLSDLFKIYD
ncbi:hypothetical protein, partial [Moraxella lacunata]